MVKKHLCSVFCVDKDKVCSNIVVGHYLASCIVVCDTKCISGCTVRGPAKCDILCASGYVLVTAGSAYTCAGRLDKLVRLSRTKHSFVLIFTVTRNPDPYCVSTSPVTHGQHAHNLMGKFIWRT